jgi:hypothetical protein
MCKDFVNRETYFRVEGNSMKTIIYAILYVIVTPFWWFFMQIDHALSKLYMHSVTHWTPIVLPKED